MQNIDIIVADDNGTFKLILWEQLIDPVHTGLSYHFYNLTIIPIFDDEKFVNSNELTTVEPIDDITIHMETPEIKDKLLVGQFLLVINLYISLSLVINLSLRCGIFADQWKCALLHPLLKKLGLEPIFQNFRPVSNLQYISKLTEKAVFVQTQFGQMVTNDIYPELQSSYREHHSTETALLKVMNDVLLKMNSQHVTLLILLDLSAAFDTVNHSILLDQLTKVVGLQGKAHEWFCLYLSGWSQRVAIDGSMSMEFSWDCGVPQVSCMGPLLFVIYTSSLFKIIECHLPQVHCYADDTQLYLSFRLGDDVARDAAHHAMEVCIKDIEGVAYSRVSLI